MATWFADRGYSASGMLELDVRARELLEPAVSSTVPSEGAEEVEEYLVASAEAIEKGTVEFLDLVAQDGNYYFRWVMTIRFKRFARGEEKRSVGMTHVRFDAAGEVVLHQDSWDSSAGLFEHVPALGWMLRRTKKRL